MVVVRICVFVETVDSSLDQVDEPPTGGWESVGTDHEGAVVVVEFVERTAVPLVGRQPVRGLDSDRAFERTPETHVSGRGGTARRRLYLCSSIAGSPAILLQGSILLRML